MTTPEVVVIAHWELPAALSSPKAQKKMLIRWTHTVKAFGVRDLVLVDVDGLNPIANDAEMTVSIVNTLDEALELYPSHTPVYVEKGGAALTLFSHPAKAAYIFGSDFGDLPQKTIGIPTHNALHADVTCGIVLHDRSIV